MKYRAAKKLKNGDEVTLKAGGTRRVVLAVDFPANKFVSVLCDDGVEYHHLALR